MKLKLLKFKSVKSTNDVALRLIKKRYYRPTIISSEKQTNGRGTMGKKWISKKGNLFLTIFFELNQKKIDFKKCAILNAYLIKAILVKNFSNKIKIKWPNDLLIEKKKICGILQETVNNHEKKFLIVGIGINTNYYPKMNNFSSTSIKKIINKSIDNNKLLNIIRDNYEKFLFKSKKNGFSELKKLVNNL